MNQKEQSPEQSELRTLLMQAEIALQQNRYEDALALLNKINMDEISTLPLQELHAVGNLINYVKNLAEEKKSQLVSQLKALQAGKEYL